MRAENQISHRGGRACGRGGQARTLVGLTFWCAVVQGRRATTSRTYAFRRYVRVVVLGPAASTGQFVHAPRLRSDAWLPSAGTAAHRRRRSLRRADLLRLACAAETSWRREPDQFRPLDAAECSTLQPRARFASEPSGRGLCDRQAASVVFSGGSRWSAVDGGGQLSAVSGGWSALRRERAASPTGTQYSCRAADHQPTVSCPNAAPSSSITSRSRRWDRDVSIGTAVASWKLRRER